MNQVIKEKHLDNGGLFQLVHGDITMEEVDAIVNAANSQLLHGGGVAGIISRKGGTVIQEESHKIAPIAVGSAGITTAGKLPARFVIHAVGPRWGEGNEEEKLADAIRSSLRLAEEKGMHSISLPAISTGIFGFPLNLAVTVFYQTIGEYFHPSHDDTLKKIRLCLFDKPTLDAFLRQWHD